MTSIAERLELPVEGYKVEGHHFGKWVRGRFLPSMHLGEDIITDPGTPVKAIGAGRVFWSEMRLGSEQRRNWGGVVVVEHCDYMKEKFYSVYGHLTDLQVSVGDRVAAGQPLGQVAAGLTPENGWWKLPHLHFAIYTGPWRSVILPGYWRLWERRTFPWQWRNPKKFIEKYNLVNSGKNKNS